MSAIYGYINLDGRPVEPEILQNMKQAMAFCGPDGSSEWLEGNCGMGQLLLFNTPESVNEKYPLIDASGNIIFMAACRIDNRAELFNLLDTPNELKHSITDGELMFQSYLKWGENACDKMLGDWSFVAWHKKEQKVFLARDHHGPTGMYYYQDNDKFVFASSMKGILQVPWLKKEVNQYWLVKFVANIPDKGVETVLKNIYYLANAHHLTIAKKEIKKFRYWILEDTPKANYKSDASIKEAFLDVYFKAIQDRTRSYRGIGANLSGGLDSNSVVYYLSKKFVNHKKMEVFSVIPSLQVSKSYNDKYVTNEYELIKCSAEYYGNININWIKTGELNLIENIDNFYKYVSEPISGPSNASWIYKSNSLANELNISALLNAYGGNFSTSWPSVSLFNYHSHKYINLFKESFRAFFNIDEFKPSKINSELIKFITEPPILTNYYKENHEQILDNKIYRIDENHYNNYLKQISYNKNSVQINQLSQLFHIETRDPSMDKLVLSFIASLPISIFFKNYPRYLIRSAFQDYIPNKVLWNNKRGLQSSDITSRINNERKEFENEIKCFFQSKKISKLFNLNHLVAYSKQDLLEDTVSNSPYIFFRYYSLIKFLNKLL